MQNLLKYLPRITPISFFISLVLFNGFLKFSFKKTANQDKVPGTCQPTC